MNETIDILAIDDNIDDRSLYQRSLKEAFGDKMRFMEAGSGESGIKAIESATPHCVLLDYSLPGHNGIEILKRIRVKYPHLPIIMLTGQGNETVAVQSMKEGAQDYIVKSAITPEALERIIRVAIEHNAMQKSIYEQRSSLDIFTRALAHDLKEPMRTIRSFLDRIADWQVLCEKSQQAFQYILKAADRMNALIDTVYLYMRLDAAEQMEKTICDIAEVLEEVQENLAQLIEQYGATVTYSTLPGVQANRVQMIQLFQNLIANAIRHSETAVTIHVSAEEQADKWQVLVQDNGPGIALENCEKIFDPFKRMSVYKGGEQGLGLGLAINRKIVESHGGKIWCESMPEAGAAFLFTLPKTMAPLASENITSISAALPHEQTAAQAGMLARILLVDDNEADLILNRIMLVENGKLRSELLTARNGSEALAMLHDAEEKGNPIDLMLLDINMPIMSGFELLSEMMKEQRLPNTLVVMCTTSAYDVDKRAAEVLGAAGFLTKPPEFSFLKNIIDQCERLQLSREGNDYVLRRAA